MEAACAPASGRARGARRRPALARGHHAVVARRADVAAGRSRSSSPSSRSRPRSSWPPCAGSSRSPPREPRWHASSRSACRSWTIGWPRRLMSSSARESEAATPVARALFEDTARALGSVSASDIIAPELVRRAWWQAAAASLLLLVTGAVLIEPASRAARAAWLFASPGSLAFRVEPGNVRVRPGTPLTIRVEASASVGSLVPDLEARIGDAVTARAHVSRRQQPLRRDVQERAGLLHLSRAARRPALAPITPSRCSSRRAWRASTCRTTSRHSRVCLPAARPTAATSTRPKARASISWSRRRRRPRRSRRPAWRCAPARCCP